MQPLAALATRIALTFFGGIFTIVVTAQPVIRIDSTFNHIGYHLLNVTPHTYTVQAGDNVVVNPQDKKYIVRGFVNPLGAYLKYNRDGSLDTNFNKSGIYVQPGSERYIANFKIDLTGRLINAVSRPAIDNQVGFMRTRATGVADSIFGVNGILYVPNTADADAKFLPLENGKFLFASNFRYNDTVGLKLQQFKSNYTLDSSFGTNGAIFHKIRSYDLYIRNLTVFSDGKILVAGTTRSSPPFFPYDYDGFIFRFLPNGETDPSFANQGLLAPYAKNTLNDHYYGAYVLPDQKFIGFGFEDAVGFMARYHNNGTIDSSYGFLGRVFIPEIQFYDVQRQRDGKFLGVGQGGYRIARITVDGTRDANFGTNGVYTPPPPLDLGFAYGSLLENDTTFLITGNANNTNQSNNITTARYALRFQPFVTGVRSKYCLGDNGTGSIINLPLPGSDTIVSVLLDSNTVLPLNAQGQFSFPAGTAGKHTIQVRFTKGTFVWREVIQFTTGTVQPVIITTPPQLLCVDGSSFTVRANVPCYWYTTGISVKAPTGTVSFDPSGKSGINQIIAARDNAGCVVTMDTLMLEVIQLTAAISENSGVLNATVYPGAGYQWYRNNSRITGATGSQFTPAANGNYTVEISLANCSKTSAPFAINSFPPPIPVPSIGNIASEYCSNIAMQNAKLLNPPPAPATITITMDGTGLTYNAADSSFLFSISAAGNHTVSVKYASTVENKIKDTIFTVKPTPSAGAQPVQSVNKLTIPVTGSAYQWYRNGSIIAGAVQQEYTITQPGQYAYTYTVNGCTSPLSAQLNATITAILDPATNRQIFFSPNPAREYLYVSGLGEQFRYALQIVDMRGVTVKEVVITRQLAARIYIGKLARGMYLCRLHNVTTKTFLGIEKVEIL